MIYNGYVSKTGKIKWKCSQIDYMFASNSQLKKVSE